MKDPRIHPRMCVLQVGCEALVAEDDPVRGNVLLAVRLPERTQLQAHVAPLVERVLMAWRHLLHSVDVYVDVRGWVRRVEYLAVGKHEAAHWVLGRLGRKIKGKVNRVHLFPALQHLHCNTKRSAVASHSHWLIPSHINGWQLQFKSMSQNYLLYWNKFCLTCLVLKSCINKLWQHVKFYFFTFIVFCQKKFARTCTHTHAHTRTRNVIIDILGSASGSGLRCYIYLLPSVFLTQLLLMIIWCDMQECIYIFRFVRNNLCLIKPAQSQSETQRAKSCLCFYGYSSE